MYYSFHRHKNYLNLLHLSHNKIPIEKKISCDQQKVELWNTI